MAWLMPAIGWGILLGLTYLVSRYTALCQAVLDLAWADEGSPCCHPAHGTPYVAATYHRLRTARRAYGVLVVLTYALCFT